MTSRSVAVGKLSSGEQREALDILSAKRLRELVDLLASTSTADASAMS
jgi:hypothetical protein